MGTELAEKSGALFFPRGTEGPPHIVRPLILFYIQKYPIFNQRPARALRNEIRFIGKDCQTSLHLFHNSVERVEDTVCAEFFPKLVPQNLCRV